VAFLRRSEPARLCRPRALARRSRFRRGAGRRLLDSTYLAARARLIDPAHAHDGPAAPGDPPTKHSAVWGDGAAPELPSTSNLSVIDAAGNAVALTVTIENDFGSRIMGARIPAQQRAHRFRLRPETDGKPVANRIEPGKRPLSAMSPSIVFDPDGAVALVVGSAGGPPIITDVAKTIIAVADWHMDLATAIALPNVDNRNGATEIEDGPGTDALAAALKARGMTCACGSAERHRRHPRHAAGL